jgi:hypothetical protein
VVAVAPVVLDRQRGLLLVDEGLAGRCAPADGTPGLSSACEPTAFRLGYRDLHTGRLVSVIRQGAARTRGLHDAADGLFAVLDLPGEHLEDPRSEDLKPYGHGARRATVYRGAAMVRVVEAEPGTRLLCARLIPRRGLLALCVVPETPAGADFLKVEERTYQGLPSWGDVQLVDLATGKRTATTRYAYRPGLREVSSCVPGIFTPEGWLSSLERDDSACRREDQACHVRPDPAACSKLPPGPRYPREQALDVVASPDGRELTVLAFGDLHQLRLEGGLVRRGGIADVTFRDRHHQVHEPRLTLSDSGRAVVLHGRGRLLRVVRLRDLALMDVPVTQRFVTQSLGEGPAVPTVHLAADDRTLTFAAPDRSVTTVDLVSGRPARTLPASRVLAFLPAVNPAEPVVAWPWFLHLTPRRLLVQASGHLVLAHPVTGQPEAWLGVHAPSACRWHPYGC